MFTTDNTQARLDRVRAIETRDPSFLTRRERYNEVIWELKRRLRQAEQIPGCVWRNAVTPFADNH